MGCIDPSHDTRCTPEKCALMRDRETSPDWQYEASILGVNPAEPDDHRYWSELGRRKALIDSFRYHKPNDAQVDRIATVRAACIDCARAILRCTPASADQTVALRKLHEAMMTANKSIVCEVTS